MSGVLDLDASVLPQLECGLEQVHRTMRVDAIGGARAHEEVDA